MILVSGSNGFFGRAVLSTLLAQGLEVVGITRKDADLTDPVRTLACFKKIRPQTVVHTAALCGGIGLNANSPATMLDINSRINLNVLAAAAEVGVKRFVAIGSSCAYPDRSRPLQTNDFFIDTPHPSVYGYGLSKRFLWALQEAYERQSGMAQAHLVFPNIYGPKEETGDRAHIVGALIARFHAAVLTGLPQVVVWGTGNARRELMYVEDAAAAVAWAVSENIDGLMNVGTGIAYSVREIAETIASAIGFTGEIVFDATKPEGNAIKVMEISPFVAQALPTPHSLAEGIRKTVAWYQKRHELIQEIAR